MKTATLLLLISALLSVTTRAATVSFSDIPSTNVVNASDLLLLDSHLGGTNYSTRTLTVSNLSSVIMSSNNWQNVGPSDSSLAGVASAGGIIVSNAAFGLRFYNDTNGVMTIPSEGDTEFGDYYFGTPRDQFPADIANVWLDSDQGWIAYHGTSNNRFSALQSVYYTTDFSGSAGIQSLSATEGTGTLGPIGFIGVTMNHGTNDIDHTAAYQGEARVYGSGSFGNAYIYQAQAGNDLGTGRVWNFAGFYMDDFAKGTTNNYVLLSDLNSGSGKYFVYGRGTAPSHFGGAVDTKSITITNGSSGSDVVINGSTNNVWLLNANIGGVSYGGITNNGQWLFPDGSAAAPSICFASTADGSGTGFWMPGNNQIYVAINGTSTVLFNSTSMLIPTANNISWSDLFLSRDNTATLQLGSDGASTVAQTIKAADGSGTDKDGSSLTLEGGQSTGTGRGGTFVIRTAKSGAASASTANAYEDRARYVPKYVDLLDGVATNLFTVTLPATNIIGMSFTCTVMAGNGTDFQSLTTQVTVDAVAKTTTITPVVAPTGAQSALAGSSGTLSVTYSVSDAGSNVLNVKCLADTSLTPTFLRAKIVMTGINIMGAGVVINEL